MRRKNMREGRRCNGGQLLRGALVGLVATGVLVAAAPATATARPVPHASRPVLGYDIYLYHPILQSVLQKPPLDTLIRFRTEEYTSFLPRQFHMVVHLYWWRSAKALHRAKGRWVEIHPTVRYGIADLAAVGTHHQLKAADWTCEQGRFYIRVHVYGITHTGRHEHDELFFPWAGFNRKNLDKGNANKAPTLHQAWDTKCQGSRDTLVG